LSAIQEAQAITGLHDVVSPEAVGWWPLAPGWWAVLVALLSFAVWRAWVAYRAWQADGYRRAALEELAVIEAGIGDPAQSAGAMAGVAALLKRTALCAAPREAVASITGETWLGYLDRGTEEAPFTLGAGRRLPELTYRDDSREFSPEQAREIVSVARRWIREHRAS
jgi:hypothetical protein